MKDAGSLHPKSSLHGRLEPLQDEKTGFSARKKRYKTLKEAVAGSNFTATGIVTQHWGFASNSTTECGLLRPWSFLNTERVTTRLDLSGKE